MIIIILLVLFLITYYLVVWLGVEVDYLSNPKYTFVHYWEKNLFRKNPPVRKTIAIKNYFRNDQR